jgi:hypothetical protein
MVLSPLLLAATMIITLFPVVRWIGVLGESDGMFSSLTPSFNSAYRIPFTTKYHLKLANTQTNPTVSASVSEGRYRWWNAVPADGACG